MEWCYAEQNYLSHFRYTVSCSAVNIIVRGLKWNWNGPDIFGITGLENFWKSPDFYPGIWVGGTLITEDRFAWIAAFKSAENYHAENLTNPYSELTSSRNSCLQHVGIRSHWWSFFLIIIPFSVYFAMTAHSRSVLLYRRAEVMNY